MGISVTIGGIFLYKSYAYYENDKEYNVIKGIIPDFSYDVKFAITVDGAIKNAIPTEPKDKSKNTYYEVTAECDDGITAEWDYNAWNLKVENINKGTKCKLAFNSTLTETDYKNYIEAGVAYRRNTYRGKDITSYLENGDLFDMISSGKFDDIFVGDYIVSPTSKKTSNLKDVNNQTVVWLIADLDNYLYSGNGTEEKNPENILKKHHVTIIPATPLIKAKMNSTAITTGGYANSEMVQTTLTTVLNKYIDPDFSTHVIEYNNLLTNTVKAEANNQYGLDNGASNNWEWIDRKLDLMDEISIFGTSIWSSSGFDSGIDNEQYAIFRLNPSLRFMYKNTKMDYWLKDVVSNTYFAAVDGRGQSGHRNANIEGGVRPRFLID